MSNEPADADETTKPHQGAKPGRFLGSLKDALAAASRDDTHRGGKPQSLSAGVPATGKAEPVQKKQSEEPRKDAGAQASPPAGLSAAAAAAEIKAQTSLKPAEKPELVAPPTTRVVRGGAAANPAPEPEAAQEETSRTQLVRGKVQVERGAFKLDPVVGWLVVVGGPGIGNFRPIFEGNNTVGRSPTQRVPINFGDDTISSEEQAYIRYDSSARSFLFVPNLAKTNVVSVNDKRPTGAVELSQMDVITMGRTQLVFVPFCGAEFDWAELTDAKS
jgi:hypothetical protein